MFYNTGIGEKSESRFVVRHIAKKDILIPIIMFHATEGTVGVRVRLALVGFFLF